jgi:hypothetical protein
VFCQSRIISEEPGVVRRFKQWQGVKLLLLHANSNWRICTGFRLHRFLFENSQGIYTKNWEISVIYTSVVDPDP